MQSQIRVAGYKVVRVTCPIYRHGHGYVACWVDHKAWTVKVSEFWGEEVAEASLREAEDVITSRRRATAAA